MKRICSVCGKCYGIKPPYEDDSESHGYCSSCLAKEMAKIEAMQKEAENEKYD